MAEISKFFNSTVTDERWYQAQDFAEYFWMFLTSGLIHVDREPFINVEVVEDSLQLKVTPGPALIKGHLYRNTKDLYLTVDTPDVLEDRFDRLVLQLDLLPEDGKAGRIKALIKKGVASNDPVVPELTRNERIFELSLGYFRVRKNTASIAQLDYVDERLHEDYCGIVNSLITAPTQAMQQQFDLWLGLVDEQLKEWLDSLKTLLGEDDLSKLGLQVIQNKEDILELEDKVILKKEKGQPLGIPTLDSEGLIPFKYIPPLITPSNKVILKEIGEYTVNSRYKPDSDYIGTLIPIKIRVSRGGKYRVRATLIKPTDRTDIYFSVINGEVGSSGRSIGVNIVGFYYESFAGNKTEIELDLATVSANSELKIAIGVSSLSSTITVRDIYLMGEPKSFLDEVIR